MPSVSILLGLFGACALRGGPAGPDLDDHLAGPLPWTAPVFEGTLDALPVVHWMRVLPGSPGPSAGRSEPGRPLVDGASIYVGSSAADALFRMSRADGSVTGRYQANGPVMSQPVRAGADLVFCDGAGFLWRYPLAGGPSLWSHHLGAPCLARPVVQDGTVYVSAVNNVVQAVSLEKGEVLWRYENPVDLTRKSELELLGSPEPVVHGDRLLAGFHDGRVVSLDRQTGDLAWERRVGDGRYPDVIGGLLVQAGDVYAGGFSSPFLALDLASQTVRWRQEFGVAAEAAVAGQNLYAGGTDGKLRALDRITGAMMWEWDSGTAGSLTQPQVTPVGLLVASSDGGLWLVDAVTGTTRWTLETGQVLLGISAAPVVEGRQAVVVTNAGQIVSLVAPAGNLPRPEAEPPWVP